MQAKAFARYIYAHVPGAASARFAAKDALISFTLKPEYRIAKSIRMGCVVDIGAHRGEGVIAFRKMHPKSDIIAFEPLPRSADYLRRRFSKDCAVTVHNYALGNENRELTLYTPSYGRWHCDGIATTIPEEAAEWLNGKVLRYDKSMHKLEECRISCRTLDSFGLTPSLIKIHAQHAEISILEGAVHTLRAHHPALMCAFPTPDVLEFLKSYGYMAFHMEGKRLVYGPQKDHSTTFTWFM